MLEEITALDFYKDHESDPEDFYGTGATGLITTDGTFTVFSKDEAEKLNSTTHLLTSYKILKNKYGIDIDIDSDVSVEKIENEVKKYNEDGLNSSICIQYASQLFFPWNFVRILVPSYITSYQCKELEDLNEELKEVKSFLDERHKDENVKFLIGVEVVNYNPLTHSLDDSLPAFRISDDNDVFEDKSIDEALSENKDASMYYEDPIKEVVNYMKTHNRINDSIKGFERVDKVSTGIRI